MPSLKIDVLPVASGRSGVGVAPAETLPFAFARAAGGCGARLDFTSPFFPGRREEWLPIQLAFWQRHGRAGEPGVRQSRFCASRHRVYAGVHGQSPVEVQSGLLGGGGNLRASSCLHSRTERTSAI